MPVYLVLVKTCKPVVVEYSVQVMHNECCTGTYAVRARSAFALC